MRCSRLSGNDMTAACRGRRPRRRARERSKPLITDRFCKPICKPQVRSPCLAARLSDLEQGGAQARRCPTSTTDQPTSASQRPGSSPPHRRSTLALRPSCVPCLEVRGDLHLARKYQPSTGPVKGSTGQPNPDQARNCPDHNTVNAALTPAPSDQEADRPTGRRRAGVPPTRHRARGPTARARA